MLNIRRADARGLSHHDGRISWHTFSFGEYFAPEYNGFSDLLVINDDCVKGGHGFGAHSHRDMEILTYVLEGTLAHRDSMGGSLTLYSGEVQLMSAGMGVIHSEMNASPHNDVHFLQIWIVPAERGLAPRYQQRVIAPSEKEGRLALIVSANGGSDSLTIAQDVDIYIGTFTGHQETTWSLRDGRAAWLHVAEGQLQVNNHTLQAGDGVAIKDEPLLVLHDGQDAKVILFDLRYSSD